MYSNYEINNIYEKIQLKDKVVLGDPCYSLNSVSIINNVLPGTYCTIIRVVDCDSWGNRVSRLMAFHENHAHKIQYNDDNPETLYDSFTGLKCSDSEIIGVDSGQAGIYDYDYFCENEKERNYNDKNSWYRKICDMTIESHGGCLDNKCVVSNSGYGDGGYKTYLFKTKDTNQVVGFVIDFDVENEYDYKYEGEYDFDDEEEEY